MKGIRQMDRIITIKWDNLDKHKVKLIGNGYQGFCITHSRDVTQNSRCPEFPVQTAMWNDLWRMAERISSSQK